MELLAQDRDRPLSGRVDEGEGAPLRLVTGRRVDAEAKLLEALPRATPQLVVSDRDEEVNVSCEVAKLPGRDRPSAGRLFPGRRGTDDLALLGKPFDGREANPLDMSDNRGSHNSPPICVREDDGSRARSRRSNLSTRSIAMRCSASCAACLVATGRRMPTRRRSCVRFVRTGGLRNADNLRAWVMTIARRVAVDQLRRREASPPTPEPAIDSRPAYAELGELADDLPRKERAAVVLRYGYDLSYAAIGAALGSSEDAARQAASSGVRRLRRRMQ